MTRLTLTPAPLAALVLPAAAQAKGPTEGSISGPGFAKVVKVANDDGNLTQQSGFFPPAFGQSPDPLLHARPAGKLGPRYKIVWTVPNGEGTSFRIHQDLYPYAQDGAVTYMKPGRRIFETRPRGGWSRTADLPRTLVALGLPASAPAEGSGFDYPLVFG